MLNSFPVEDTGTECKYMLASMSFEPLDVLKQIAMKAIGLKRAQQPGEQYSVMPACTYNLCPFSLKENNLALIRVAIYVNFIRIPVSIFAYTNEVIPFNFQSNQRDADFVMTRAVLGIHIFLQNDFIQPLGGSYNFRLISSKPEEATNFLTTINPFDGYTWAAVLFSVIAVAFTLIIIDKTYAKWSNLSTDEIFHKSKF